MSNILKIDKDNPDKTSIMKATAILRDGGIIVSPTETLYGILGRADRNDIVREIYNIKKRNITAPCSIFVNSTNEMARLGEYNNTVEELASSFLPGPLTLVLKNLSSFKPPIIIDEKIGFRLSSSPVIAAVLENLNCPLTATSANLSGRPEPSTIEEISKIFGEKVNLYLDSGPLISLTSTVVECLDNKFNILRHGAVSEADIRNCMKG